MSLPEAGLLTAKEALKCESVSCVHNCIGSAEISPHPAATGLPRTGTKTSIGGSVYTSRFRTQLNLLCQEFSGLHPLRSPDSTTLWVQLTPLRHLQNAPQRKQRKTQSLCLQPSAGGRCRKSKLVFEPATEPTCYRMGNGPRLEPGGLSYYHRAEHMQTNQTKNKTPNISRKLNCIRVLILSAIRYQGSLDLLDHDRRRPLAKLSDMEQNTDAGVWQPWHVLFFSST